MAHIDHNGNDIFINSASMPNQTTPSTPSGSQGKYYVGSDNKPYFIDDGGNILDLSAGGVQGPQGFQGFQGSSEVGVQGFQGDTGDAGLQGFQGDVGSEGIQGFQGDIGPQGSGSSGGSFAPTAFVDVTADASPATSDLGKLYRFTTACATGKTITLPSVGSGEDEDFLWIENESEYVQYVEASDSDYIGYPQLKVLEIEMLPNTQLLIQYIDGDTRWHIREKTGTDQVRPKGTVLYMPMNEMGVYDSTVTATVAPNIAGADFYGRGAVNSYVGTGAFDGSCYTLNDATSDSLDSPDSDDWDIMESTTGTVTVCGWVYHDDAIGSSEAYLAQYDDSNNYYRFNRNSSGNLAFLTKAGGSIRDNMSGGTVASTGWHHVAVVIKDDVIGLYIDGTQVAYDSDAYNMTLTGSLYFGQRGDGSSEYLDGKMDDWAIVYSNIFGASPNATPDDTIDVDTNNPLNLIM